MANTWRASDGEREITFRSTDFSAFDLADELFLPIWVVDQTDGDRLVAVIDSPEDPFGGSRVEVSWG